MRTHDLRGPSRKVLAALGTAGLCDLVWQGDFGTGQSTGSGVWSDPGANPCKVYPLNASAASGTGLGISTGIPQPNFRLGMTCNGDYGSEFIYCQLVLASATDLLPGQAYEISKEFALTLLTTSNSVLQEEVGVLNVWYPQAPAGTYYCWLQRAGRCAIQAAASSITAAQAETTATAGVVKFLNSHTAGTKSSDGITSFGASSSITFTGTTVSGSPYITAVVSNSPNGGIEDLQVGQVITGTGLPSNSIIAAITKTGNTWQITIGTNTAGSYSVLQNATASNSGITFTVTNMVVANLYWGILKTQN
jgi:hypothetical protein